MEGERLLLMEGRGMMMVGWTLTAAAAAVGSAGCLTSEPVEGGGQVAEGGGTVLCSRFLL